MNLTLQQLQLLRTVRQSAVKSFLILTEELKLPVKLVWTWRDSFDGLSLSSDGPDLVGWTTKDANSVKLGFNVQHVKQVELKFNVETMLPYVEIWVD